MMDILVTGASGFIGTHLCRKLNELSHNVDGLDIRAGEFTNINKDVRTFKFSKKYDVVFHLASLIDARDSVEKENEYFSVIVDGTKNLLKKEHVGVIILTSSVAAHEPINPYGKFKLRAEEEIKESGIPFKIFRLANVYGPGSSSVVEKFAEIETIKIYGDGEQVRDFIHVEDVVNKLVDETIALNKLYYLGTGKTITLNQLAKLYNKPVKYLPEAEGDIKVPKIASDFPEVQNRLLSRL